MDQNLRQSIQTNNFYYFLIVFFFNSFIFSITIDGKLSEQEWQDAETLNNFLTVFPNDKSNPIYKTKLNIFLIRMVFISELSTNNL